MKNKNLLIITLVVVISGTISYFISSKLFAPPKDRKTQVEVVAPITTEFNKPSKSYYNEKSINPTQTIQIGDTANQEQQAAQ